PTSLLIDNQPKNLLHRNCHTHAGPNASGKSCYAKQVAIIAYMGHLGSFVPAESAVIGLADRIFTRVISLERVAHGQSSFMIDLTQVISLSNWLML
ncbi:muts domain V-domain-containing protein, partial [Dunaliella salina]